MYELRDRKRPAKDTTSIYSKASQAVSLLTSQKKETYAEIVLGIVEGRHTQPSSIADIARSDIRFQRPMRTLVTRPPWAHRRSML